LPKVIEIL